MGQLRVAMLVPVFACAMSVGNARGAVISVSGDECGTPPLLGLTFTLPTALENCSSSPDPIQGIAGSVSPEDDGPGTVYGDDILSIDFLVTTTNPLFFQSLRVGDGSALTMIELIPGGFRLFNEPGPGICPDGPSTCPVDVLITLADLDPEDLGTSMTVTAVNTTQVPEPAAVAFVATGLAAVVARRRRSRRPGGRQPRL